LRGGIHRQWTPLAHALAAVGDRWTLLIVLALGVERVRLTRLQERLPGISTGVLSHHVQEMVTLGLLSRDRFPEVPPRVEVQLTDSGRELLPIASALARWGMRRVWSAPTDGDHVDVHAILVLLPALLDLASGLPDGFLDAIVMTDEGRTHHTFPILDGRLHPTSKDHRAPGAGTARIAGDEAAWVSALGPARDYANLRFTGSRRLGRQVLDELPRRA
jgi:DNA-binding HxlR family transcriptional regulator